MLVESLSYDLVGPHAVDENYVAVISGSKFLKSYTSNNQIVSETNVPGSYTKIVSYKDGYILGSQSSVTIVSNITYTIDPGFNEISNLQVYDNTYLVVFDNVAAQCKIFQLFSDTVRELGALRDVQIDRVFDNFSFICREGIARMIVHNGLLVTSTLACDTFFTKSVVSHGSRVAIVNQFLSSSQVDYYAADVLVYSKEFPSRSVHVQLMHDRLIVAFNKQCQVIDPLSGSIILTHGDVRDETVYAESIEHSFSTLAGIEVTGSISQLVTNGEYIVTVIGATMFVWRETRLWFVVRFLQEPSKIIQFLGELMVTTPSGIVAVDLAKKAIAYSVGLDGVSECFVFPKQVIAVAGERLHLFALDEEVRGAPKREAARHDDTFVHKRSRF